MSSNNMQPAEFRKFFISLLEADAATLRAVRQDPVTNLRKLGFELENVPPEIREAFSRKMNTKAQHCAACATCALCTFCAEVDGLSTLMGVEGLLGLA